MDIYSQNIYEVIENGKKKHILIIYNISENHYVGLTVYSTELDNLTYIESINRFIDINDLQESMANFSYKRLREPFFHNKKIAHLSKYDYSNILIL